MCTSMAIWAKLDGIAYATSQPVAAEFGRQLNNPIFTFRQIHLRCREVLEKGEPRLRLFECVMEDEAFALLEKLKKKLQGS